jgi:hypothetical protein
MPASRSMLELPRVMPAARPGAEVWYAVTEAGVRGMMLDELEAACACGQLDATTPALGIVANVEDGPPLESRPAQVLEYGVNAVHTGASEPLDNRAPAASAARRDPCQSGPASVEGPSGVARVQHAPRLLQAAFFSVVASACLLAAYPIPGVSPFAHTARTALQARPTPTLVRARLEVAPARPSSVNAELARYEPVELPQALVRDADLTTSNAAASSTRVANPAPAAKPRSAEPAPRRDPQRDRRTHSVPLRARTSAR